MISALRAATVSSHDDASQAKSAGQPEEVSNKRLVRSFDTATFLGYSGGLVAIFTIIIPIDTFYAMGAAAYVFFSFMVILVLMTSEVRKREEADELCDERWQTISKLHNEISHLKQDVTHWKAISFAQRGDLTVAKGAVTAAGTPVSEKHQDVSAAVVEFSKPKGAA